MFIDVRLVVFNLVKINSLTTLRKEYGMVTKIGLDLGYANITLSDVMAEIYREPSVALIYKNARPDARRII